MTTGGPVAGSVGEAIEAVAEPVLRAHGLTLVDLEARGGGRRMVVRFFVDKPGGVRIDDCQRFSREIGDVLDVADVVPGNYDLEVSSPGLDRELRKERELRWAVGRSVRIWTREPVDGQREHLGELVGVTEVLTLAVAEGFRHIPRELASKARLEERPVSA